MWKRRLAAALLMAIASSLFEVALAEPGGAQASRSQPPIAAEQNPSGDIPDSQAFVEYRSPLGFSIKAPEGWARRELTNGVSFSDKYNRVQVTVSARPSAPTVAGVKARELNALVNSPQAILVTGVAQVALQTGSVVVVHYGANSDVNPVTNKAIRLDNASYYFWKVGKLAVMTLSAPAGADNLDQWQLMARSFTWQ